MHLANRDFEVLVCDKHGVNHLLTLGTHVCRGLQ